MAVVEIYQQGFKVTGEKDPEFRWRLVAGNGEIIASGEAHTRREDAVRAWETVWRTVAGENDLSARPLIPVKHV